LVAKLEDPASIPSAAPRSEQEALELAERHGSTSTSWAVLGMFEWRHSLGDARKTLRMAVEAGVKAAQLLAPYRTPKDYLSPVHFAPAIFLARLTHGRFLPDLVAMLPAFETWKSGRTFQSYCDRAHLTALEQRQYPEKWKNLIAAFRRKAALRLVADTNECYADIVRSCHDEAYPEAVEKIKLAGELYERRKRNREYRNTWNTEGGGEYNAHEVDYTLAAIVEHLFAGRKKLLADVPPDHLWPY